MDSRKKECVEGKRASEAIAKTLEIWQHDDERWWVHLQTTSHAHCADSRAHNTHTVQCTWTCHWTDCTMISILKRRNEIAGGDVTERPVRRAGVALSSSMCCCCCWEILKRGWLKGIELAVVTSGRVGTLCLDSLRHARATGVVQALILKKSRNPHETVHENICYFDTCYCTFRQTQLLNCRWYASKCWHHSR